MSTSEEPHLLSVEDYPETRLVLKHLLKDSYEVTLTSGAEGAPDVISFDRTFDLLLDINLESGTEMEGTEPLHTIRARGDTGDIPAIAATAFAMPGDREGLFEKGFDGHVDKPLTGRSGLRPLSKPYRFPKNRSGFISKPIPGARATSSVRTNISRQSAPSLTTFACAPELRGSQNLRLQNPPRSLETTRRKAAPKRTPRQTDFFTLTN
jgi:CheY-like chemotaxis protein